MAAEWRQRRHGGKKKAPGSGASFQQMPNLDTSSCFSVFSSCMTEENEDISLSFYDFICDIDPFLFCQFFDLFCLKYRSFPDDKGSGHS